MANGTRLDQPKEKKARYWDSKAPQEKWDKSIPAIQISTAIYEAIQEIAASPQYEYGGKMAPVIREALEEFVQKYGADFNTPTMTMFRQHKIFRDYWVEEIITGELLASAQTIESNLDRWKNAGNVEKIVITVEKIMESVRVLPDDHRQLILDKMKGSGIVKSCIDWALDRPDELRLEDKQSLEMAHDVLFGSD